MEIIGPIIIILFIVVPLIGVVASKVREGQPPPGRQGGPADNRRIQEQIDEFLRRAGQRRAGPPPVAAQQAPVPAEIVDDDQVGTGVGRQSRKFLDTSDFGRRSEAMGGEMAQADEQFTQQVQNAFSGQVGKLSTRRGESAQAPEVVDADVPEAEVVEADEISRPTLTAPPADGSGLVDLMGSPANIAHAIIMSEILHRPDWY